ncbi:hypothetical protein AAMO2058_001385600 [Amorphochlora amoebiformis]
MTMRMMTGKVRETTNNVGFTTGLPEINTEIFHNPNPHLSLRARVDICLSHDSESSSEEDEVGPILNGRERLSALRQQCVSELRTAFKDAYGFVRKLRRSRAASSRGHRWILEELGKILKISDQHKLTRAYNMLDHLHFAESSFIV